MKSDMKESDSPLVFVHYRPYLQLALEVLQKQPLFTITPKELTIAIAKIALQTTQEVHQRKNSRQAVPPLYSYTIGTRLATIHLDSEQELHELGKLIMALRDEMKNQLITTVTSSTLRLGTPNEYIQNLSTPLTQFQAKNAPFGLSYPFQDPQNLKKRRIHIRSKATRPSAATIRYRGHKLTITLEGIGDFTEDLIDGFCNLLQAMPSITSQDLAEVRKVLLDRKDDPASELAKLRKLIKEETLGKIKVDASWYFLIHLCEVMEKYHQHLATVPPQENAGLQELRRQLQMFARFRLFLKETKLPETAYQVRYAGESFHILSLFGRSDAYDILPIFPEIAGALGEVQEQTKDEQTFTYGLRLKLNGSVGTVGSTFEYYARLLDPKNSEHQERLTNPLWNKHRFAEEVIQIAVLYTVLFHLPNDLHFDQNLQDFIGHLNTDTDAAKEQLLHHLSSFLLQTGQKSNQFAVQLEQARIALEHFLRRPSVGPDIPPAFGYLILHNGMLHLNEDRILLQKRFLKPNLFTNEETSKEALRYVTVEEALPQQDAFYALPIRMHIEPIYLSEADDEQDEKSTLRYDIDDWHSLPVIFVPDTPASLALATQTYQQYKRITIPYLEQKPYKDDAMETALYRLLFLLLTYICLDILRRFSTRHLIAKHKQLFLPLVRIHERTQETGREKNKFPNEEKVMRSITKALAHLFSCERSTLSNTQGFHTSALQGDRHKLSNGLSSLYNLLPRIITRPTHAPNTLDKVAMIVISSRASDKHTGTPFQRMCVYGEIIGGTRLPDGTLRIERHSTFVVNEDSDNLYKTPRTLLDEVRRCHKAGYHHIFYVAKAPYTSTVHFTGKEESDELFFMSPHIIGGVLTAFPDVMLYPVFCDRYYVIKVNGQILESLYVDETSELRSLMTDPHKSIVVFFNVLNGITVDPKDVQKGHRYYNGVVSYETMINMYDNPLYDQAIRNNLLDNTQPGSLRPDMLDFLSYIHGIRYERREAKGVQLKLDPYEEMIGFDSVGSRSIIPSTDFRVRSNMLALLTLVQGILRREIERKPVSSAPPPSSPPSNQKPSLQEGENNAQ
jgi:hypothetical protein